ncbi:hypothetical protein PSTT_09847 [Puccinia striiformis]|uniref:Chloride channel protein n=1 Tax=Puccinia striiformis TaxID=27350 RepID=A0A2S4V6W0_9BASI|nr:hypothetical protein PSTT_09847 [Puccinia striiformis]
MAIDACNSGVDGCPRLQLRREWPSTPFLAWMQRFRGVDLARPNIKSLIYTICSIYSDLFLLNFGSGISKIKCVLSGFDKPGFLSFKTLFIKPITLPSVIASGLSIGKEGPSIHMAASMLFVLAGQFQRFSSRRLKMRELITAASAAGVAIAFGSPVGGVLFAFEISTFSLYYLSFFFLGTRVASGSAAVLLVVKFQHFFSMSQTFKQN